MPQPIAISATPLFHLHLVSDSTGETLQSIAKAALAQFADAPVQVHHWSLIRSGKHMERVFDDIRDHPGLILYTVVNKEIRDALIPLAAQHGFSTISVLDPVIDGLTRFLGMRAKGRAGLQHALDAEYFRRVDALQYSIAHDDGHMVRDLSDAEIILVGVSRTSKTPTCFYLANRGYRTANIPFVPGADLPSELLDGTSKAMIVGLSASPERLIDIRTQRLRMLNQPAGTEYVDPDAVKSEILACKRFCAEQGWPMIDVTRRSIEETAATIIALLQQRQEKAEREPE